MAEYSEMVRRFLDENRPAQIQWDVPTSEVWAMAVPGFDVAYREERSFQWYGPWNLLRRTIIERTLFAVSTLKSGEEVRIEMPFTITWGDRVVDGEVEYYPRISGAWGYTHEMGAKIVAAAGLKPVRVALPEPLITLPVPGWVSAVSWDGWGAAVPDTITTFESDARARWAEFIVAGEAAIGGTQ